MWSIADKLVELRLKNKVFGELGKSCGMMMMEPQVKQVERMENRNGSCEYRQLFQEVL